MTPESLPKRRNWPTLLLCASIFLCGAILGAGIAVIVRTEDWPRPRRSIEQRADRMANNIGEELGLDAKQIDEIRQIALERYTKIHEISLEKRPEMKAQAWLLDAGVRAVLTDDRQRARWDELWAKLYEKWFEAKPSDDAEWPESQPAGTTPFAPPSLGDADHGELETSYAEQAEAK